MLAVSISGTQAAELPWNSENFSLREIYAQQDTKGVCTTFADFHMPHTRRAITYSQARIERELNKAVLKNHDHATIFLSSLLNKMESTQREAVKKGCVASLKFHRT